MNAQQKRKAKPEFPPEKRSKIVKQQKKPKTLPADPLRESKNHFALVQKNRYRNRMEKWLKQMIAKHQILNDSGECLSYNMLNEHSSDHLKDRDGDAISAKMAFATDTGLGRGMHDAEHLHYELDQIKNGMIDGHDIPPKFKNLKSEMEKENNPKNLERIVQSFKRKISRFAKLKACASCGIRNFEMGQCKFYETKLSQLDALAYTKAELADYMAKNDIKK